MRHQIAVMLGIVTIQACARGEPPADSRSVSQSVSATRSLRERADSELIAHLQHLSPPLTGDTIHLYSAEGDSADAMHGKAISSDDRRFFRAFYDDVPSGDDIFAIGYTTIAPGFTAYVLRVPSKYSSSAVALFVRNETKKYWLPPATVADAFGDEGWSFSQDAWLVDHDRDGDRDLIQRRIDDDDGRQVGDTLQWTFWQEAFDHFGWVAKLKDARARQVFVNRRR